MAWHERVAWYLGRPLGLTPSRADREGNLMGQVGYSVAMSLDGYIAGPNGEADWIVMDPDFDFGAIFSRFDTLLIGRKTFAAMQAMGGDSPGMPPGVRSVVISH